ncbi:MAG TPA: HupE/UreJ family protein [Chitinophagaceae bacterium]
MRQYFKFIFTILIMLFVTEVFAHAINYQMEKAPVRDVFRFYFSLGVDHIVPDGLDHILFVVGLCMLNPKLKVILWQATAFTLAHSISLALSMKNIIVLPAAIVEPVIALSIMFVSLENILFGNFKAGRIVVVFLFGLIHGLGFAGSLNETGLPRDKFLTSIVSFNAGVETGQIIVIIAVFALLIFPFSKKTWYKKFIANPISLLIALIAAYWTIIRVIY